MPESAKESSTDESPRNKDRERLGLTDVYQHAKNEPDNRDVEEKHSLVAGLVVGVCLTVIGTSLVGTPSSTAAIVAVVVFFATSMLWAQPWKWQSPEEGDDDE